MGDKMNRKEWCKINRSDCFWLTELKTALNILPELLDQPTKWDSLIVNRRKPHTYRAFYYSTPKDDLTEGTRLCLHRFDPCGAEDAFPHPHPWPGAFYVAEGSYLMHVGMSSAPDKDPNNVVTTELKAGSSYAISSPLTWHSVQPLETCWSIMVNGEPFLKQHDSAPTTKGKDLDKMTSSQLTDHLWMFSNILFEDKPVEDQIKQLVKKKEEAVANQDFESASIFRDRADQLRKRYIKF